MTQKLAAAAISLLLVATLVAWVVWTHRGNTPKLEGEILKVRSYMASPEHTYAVLDIRLRNVSKLPFVIRNISATATDSAGSQIDLDLFSEMDAQRMLDYYKVLGPRYNKTLMLRDRIDQGATADRMITIRYPGTDEAFGARKALRITLTETDRAVSVIDDQRSTNQ